VCALASGNLRKSLGVLICEEKMSNTATPLSICMRTMSEHPSLTAPLVVLPSLTPKEKMGRNEQCWCNSGLKWKHCHLGREHKSPINIHQHMAQLREQITKGYCSHPDRGGCSAQIVKAHTIQRNGGLAAIKEDGHVLTTDFRFRRIMDDEARPDLQRIGVGKASTFPGFCERHDAETFREIETSDITLAMRAMFLLSYRALAFERFRKSVVVDSISVQRQLDCGRPFEVQAEIQDMVNLMYMGQLKGLAELDEWKHEYDRRLVSENLDGFHFLGVSFDQILPVVGCSAWHVESDFTGKPLQRISRGDYPLQHIAFNVTAVGGRTIASFGWTGDLIGPAKALVESFRKLPANRKADAIVRTCFEQSENIYVRPSWWKGLPTHARASLQDRILSGTPFVQREEHSLAEDDVELAKALVIDERTSW
jgi:hypothetical protein